jgi:hypothetical protein
MGGDGINMLKHSNYETFLKGSDDCVKHSETLSFRTLTIIQYCKNYKIQCFRNWICFHLQV